MEKTHFIAEHIDVWADHGGFTQGPAVPIGVAHNLEAAMQMLRDAGTKVGQVRQVHTPRRLTDGRLVPLPPTMYSYKK